jgi:hypothetical protein
VTPTARQLAMMRRSETPADDDSAVPAPPPIAADDWRTTFPPFVADSYARKVVPAASVDVEPEYRAYRLAADADDAYELGLDWRDLLSGDKTTAEALYSALHQRQNECTHGERTWGRALNLGDRRVPQDRHG